MQYTYDTHDLCTHSIKYREHKSSINEVSLSVAGSTAAGLIDSFPDYLGAKSLKHVACKIAEASHNKKSVVIAFGAHLIKVGCSPFLIDLMERGIVNAIACHNACAIHDAELAMYGETSEEVSKTILDGSFGMVTETMDFFNETINLCNKDKLGFGKALGKMLLDAKFADKSLFVKAYKLNLPATVHVAIGTDTIHSSPELNGAFLGEASLRDFRLICNVVANLDKGVWMNIGSAVILPEVFLKAVGVARNRGIKLDNITTANMDMIRHYRPHQNVVTRPGEHGYEIIGHHEIMIPLLRQVILEKLATYNAEEGEKHA